MTDLTDLTRFASGSIAGRQERLPGPLRGLHRAVLRRFHVLRHLVLRAERVHLLAPVPDGREGQQNNLAHAAAAGRGQQVAEAGADRPDVDEHGVGTVDGAAAGLPRLPGLPGFRPARHLHRGPQEAGWQIAAAQSTTVSPGKTGSPPGKGPDYSAWKSALAAGCARRDVQCRSRARSTRVAA